VTFLATVTFDLHSATSDDYHNAYLELGKVGLNTVVRSDTGHAVTLPNTTCCGEFSGLTAEAVQKDITSVCQNVFQRLRVGAKFFVVVGGDWAWSARDVPALARSPLLGLYGIR
jgi:hypothetical protein